MPTTAKLIIFLSFSLFLSLSLARARAGHHLSASETRTFAFAGLPWCVSMLCHFVTLSHMNVMFKSVEKETVTEAARSGVRSVRLTTLISWYAHSCGVFLACPKCRAYTRLKHLSKDDMTMKSRWPCCLLIVLDSKMHQHVSLDRFLPVPQLMCTCAYVCVAFPGRHFPS